MFTPMGNRLAHFVRGLSPLGPLFGKELRTTARRKRTYVLRFVYLGILLTLLLFFFFVNRVGSGLNNAGPARRAQELSELGANFFAVFAFFTLTAMTLVGPILTATAINTERLHKTLHVLLITPISAWQIVAGKLLSRLWIALTLIGLSLPALAVVRLLGGVELHHIVGTLCLCAAVALFGAALGLLASCLLSRAYSVILLSYGLLGVLYGLIPLLMALILIEFMGGGGRGGEALFLKWMSASNPFFALAVLVIPDRPMFTTWDWHWCTLAHLAAAILLILLSAALLRRMARMENEGGGLPVPAGNTAQADPSAPRTSSGTLPSVHQVSPNPTRRSTIRHVSDNPILWREIRRPLMGKRWQKFVMTLFCLATLAVIYVGLAAANDLGDPDTQIGFAIIFCGMLTVLACVLAGTAIAQEKESDTWTLLLATPQSGAAIVWGKFAGLLRRLAWPALLIIGHFLGFTLFKIINWTTLWVILYLTATTNIIWLATGLYLSLRLKTVTFAVILNLLLPVIAYGGVAMVVGIAGAVIANEDDWAEVVGLYAPYAYLVSGIESLNRHPQAYYSGNPSTPPVRQQQLAWVAMIDRVSIPTFLLIVLFVGFVHLLLTLLVLVWTAGRFDTIVGRAPQIQPLKPRHQPRIPPGIAGVAPA